MRSRGFDKPRRTRALPDRVIARYRTSRLAVIMVTRRLERADTL